MYEPKSSQIGGLGLFATKFIPKGAIWWRATKNNILKIDKDTYDTIKFIRQKTQVLYEVYKLLESIEKYAFYCEKDDVLLYILDNARYVNHSILHANSYGNSEMSISLKDIKPGEEILENYLDYGTCSWATNCSSFMDLEWVEPVIESCKDVEIFITEMQFATLKKTFDENDALINLVERRGKSIRFLPNVCNE